MNKRSDPEQQLVLSPNILLKGNQNTTPITKANNSLSTTPMGSSNQIISTIQNRHIL